VRQRGGEPEEARRVLDELVMELDRRRHEAFDWRLQVRRHARALALIAAGLVVVVGGGLVIAMAQHRRRRTLSARLAELADRGERLRLALGRIVEDPDGLAPAEPPRRAVGAATIASLALGTARALLPYVGPALERRWAQRR
jgi:hypothetical protein